jgi:hypothetical protein
MPAIHLFRGLPPVLVPIGFHCNILLGVLLASICMKTDIREVDFEDV